MGCLSRNTDQTNLFRIFVVSFSCHTALFGAEETQILMTNNDGIHAKYSIHHRLSLQFMARFSSSAFWRVWMLLKCYLEDLCRWVAWANSQLSKSNPLNSRSSLTAKEKVTETHLLSSSCASIAINNVQLMNCDSGGVAGTCTDSLHHKRIPPMFCTCDCHLTITATLKRWVKT